MNKIKDPKQLEPTRLKSIYLATATIKLAQESNDLNNALQLKECPDGPGHSHILL